jgi:hypothetical protein
MLRSKSGGLLALAVCGLCACQSPTEPDEVPEFVETSVSPDPALAAGPTGKLYTVKGEGDKPDEVREYDWKATFAVTVKLNSNATHENVDIAFPVRITAATVRVQQASGGIVTPPTSGEVERYEFVSQASSNRFAAVNSSVSMTYEVWYDLPSTRREALVSVSLTLVDDDGSSFSETIEVQVAP